MRWSEIEPLLRQGTQRTGCYEPIDLLLMTLTGRAWIWVCESDGRIDAAICAEVKQYPRKRVLDVLFGGGSNMKNWIKPLIEAVDQHAAACGCSLVASVCRKGWVRVWQGSELTGDVVLARRVKGLSDV